MNRQHILIVSFSNLKTDPRVNRQISFLKQNYDVSTIGYADSQIDCVQHYNVIHQKKSLSEKIISAVMLLIGRYEQYYNHLSDIKDTVHILENNCFDLIIANDIDALPLVLKYKKNAKVIFDAHEYAPREFEDKFFWRLFFQNYKNYLCKTYIPYVDEMLTVCDGIANEYYRQFGRLPSVITNAPDYDSTLTPSSTQNSKIRIVHHGGAIDSRKIELMIETMKYVDKRFELYLMLVPSQPKYFNHLKTLAQSMNNIFFLDPVPMEKIASTINAYDVGFYLLEPNSFNNKYALPNKFFEFIQGRLCIVVGPSVEMAAIVNQYSLGKVAPSFDPKDMAEVFNRLDAYTINMFKSNSHHSALELSSSTNREILLELIKKTLGQ